MSDPLTEAIAAALNERFGGEHGTIVLCEFLNPARGDSPMELVYEALDRVEQRFLAETI